MIKNAVKKRKAIWFAACLAVVAISVCALFFTAASSVKATFESTFDPEAEYTLNQTIVVPDATIEIEGETYVAEHYVLYPDGRKVSYDSVTLDMAGNYKLVYYAEIDGVLHTEENPFTVSFNGSGLFEGRGVAVTENQKSPDYVNTGVYEGVNLNVTSSANTVTYTSVIDLSDNDASVPIAEYLFTPAKAGTPDYTVVTVILRDYFYPEKTLTLQTRAGSTVNWPTTMIVNAWGDTQPEYNATWISVHSTGSGYIPGNDTYPVSLYFDPSSLQVWAGPVSTASDKKLIIDLDNAEDSLVSEQMGGKLWHGFTSDLVTMEITVSGMTAASADLLILNVDGQRLDGASLSIMEEKLLGGVSYGDYAAPPYGVVNREYPVFEAAVFSNIYGKIPFVSVSALYEYNETIPIVNGYFRTEKAGRYAIVYQAVSPSGKTFGQTVEIVVDESAVDPIGYVFNDRILEEADLADGAMAFYDGEPSGGVGLLTVEKSVIYNGSEIALAEGDVDSFSFAGEGTYTLRVIVTDFIGQSSTFEKEVLVTSEGAVVFSEPALPEVFYIGTVYDIPLITAKTYGETTETLSVKTEVNGTETSVFAPEQTGTAEIVYSAGGESRSYQIPVAERPAGSGFMKEFFFCSDGIESAFINKNLVFNASVDGTVVFANYLPAAALEAIVSLDAAAAEYTALDIVLTDAADKNISVVISLSPTDGTVTLNGSDVFVWEDGFTVSSLRFIYNSFDHSITTSGGTTVGVLKRTERDTPFTGFSSGLVQIQFRVRGVQGGAAFTVNDLCNHGFTDGSRDITVPVFFKDDDAAETYRVQYGEQFVVPRVSAYDVLSGRSSVEVSLIKPDYQTAEVGDSFVGDAYGANTLRYTALDGNDNFVSYDVVVYVYETIAPTISLTGKYATSAKQGETVMLASVNVSDNTSGELSVYRSILCTDGQRIPLAQDAENYTFAKAGKYIVRTQVFDESGNTAYVDYTVNVS